MSYNPAARISFKSYAFASRPGSSGINYLGGFYDAAVADTTLANGSLTQTHGTANNPHAAHVGVTL